MAKKPYGTGKTIKEIFSGISHNISRVKESTMRAAVSRLSSAMNKRLDRAEKSGVDSPAVRDARESGGRFSARGKTLEGLKAEFIRLKNFFKDPTSTQSGWNKVQKEATRQAQARGVLPMSPTPAAPPSPTPPQSPNGWYPPEGWTYNEETRSWEHPDHGTGWIPYEEEGGGLLDPITGELVGNTARSIHDYDATADNKRWGDGTETGKLWEMVDSIAKADPRFARRESYLNPADDPRMRLFDAIDDAWANDPKLSFEDARDLVAGQLDDIYESAQQHVMSTYDVGFSTYYSDEDDW